jgi:hypothetical protein
MRSADQDSKKCPSRKVPILAMDRAGLVRVLQSLIDPYRPELYYMRGPGPKWHAKHATAMPNMSGQNTFGRQ